jgi:MFS family permease
MSDVYHVIKRDGQIWKFCFYGLLKNLKFFEPYLLIYLLGEGLNLFAIGILYSIREIVNYFFEIPSGVFADLYGKKKELMLCFGLYIISFILFFIGKNIVIFSFAMVFFGLGEAFRSGTHKAMIYSYLEQKDWFDYKAFVYGRTRSFSLLGSAISAFLSIVFILNLPGTRWIFLIAIIPYMIDFLLIWSYPDSLDERKENKLVLRVFLIESVKHLKGIMRDKNINKILISSAIFDSTFKSIKDYIQPILSTILISSAAGFFLNLSSEDRLTVYLGITYGTFYIFSSIASRHVYRLNQIVPSCKTMQYTFDALAMLLLFLTIAIYKEQAFLIVLLFFFAYIIKDIRRPLFVDVIGDHMAKEQRVTVLSVDSQLRAILTVLLAPTFGFIADRLSISSLFLLVSIIILIGNRYLKIPD